MARVNIDDEARKDPRFRILGLRIGTTRFDALARMQEIWSYCTDKQVYHLSPDMIDALGEMAGFHKHLLDREVNLAAMEDEGIYIKGTKGRIEWLTENRTNSKKGGEATKAKWRRPDAQVFDREPHGLPGGQPVGGPGGGPDAEPKEGPLYSLLFSLCSKEENTNTNTYCSEQKKITQESDLRDASADGGTTDASAKGKGEETTGWLGGDQDGIEAEIIAEFAGDEALVKHLRERKVSRQVQLGWLEAFPDPPWVIQEIKKAVLWEKVNPKKKKKKFARFITGWLTRGWDRHTQGFPSTPLSKAHWIADGEINTTLDSQKGES